MKREKILIVLGAQNDDVKNNRMASSVMPNIAKAMDEALKNNYHLYVIKDKRDKDYMFSREAVWNPEPHHIQGTYGFNMAPQIDEVMKRGTYKQMDITSKPACGSIDMVKRIKDRNAAYPGIAYEAILVGGDESNIISAAVLLKSNFKDLIVSVKDDSIYYKDADALEALGNMLDSLHVRIV